MSWPRIQGIEWEDLPQCPAALRDGVTDYLRFAANSLQIYRPVVPLLVEALKATNSTKIVDLCSGGGGPWPFLRKMVPPLIMRPLEVFLTDLYPNMRTLNNFPDPAAGSMVIHYHSQSVDATKVDYGLQGFRTMFGAFHHLPPDKAQGVIADAVKSAAGIGIFEISSRSLLAILMEILGAFLVPVSVIFSRPFSFRNLFFSTLVPLIPLIVMWDGVVSCLRTYTEDELKQMVVAADPATAFQWNIGRRGVPWLGMRVTYLLGWPKG